MPIFADLPPKVPAELAMHSVRPISRMVGLVGPQPARGSGNPLRARRKVPMPVLKLSKAVRRVSITAMAVVAASVVLASTSHARPIVAAAAAKAVCPYRAEEISTALGLTFEELGVETSATSGVSSSNCSFASEDYEFIVSVSVSRWASKARFAREWKTASDGYGPIVGAPMAAVSGAKDNARVSAKALGKIQVAVTYTSGTSLVAITLNSSKSPEKAFKLKPEMVKLPHKKV
jgi:hypothetical protein